MKIAAQGQNYNPPTCLAQPTTCLVKGSHLGLQLQRATTASLGSREKREERFQSFRVGKFHLRHRRHRRHRLRGSPWYRFRYYGEQRLKTRRSFFIFCCFHGSRTHKQWSFTIYGERSNPLKPPHRYTKRHVFRATPASKNKGCKHIGPPERNAPEKAPTRTPTTPKFLLERFCIHICI